MTLAIGIIGAGEMGSAIAGRLHSRGADVVASLAGRSASSVNRVARTGVRTIQDNETLVQQSNLILSIVPPGVAVDVAQQIAQVMRNLKRPPLFVDCNAIAPVTMERIAAALNDAGADCLDVGIIGNAPKENDPGPVLYASGQRAHELEALGSWGIRVHVFDGPIGLASRMKLSYAGITKGITGIAAAMFPAAERSELGTALHQEMRDSQPALFPLLEHQLKVFPPKAYRWVAEMQEIALFLDDDKPAADIYKALAALYDQVATRESPTKKAAF